MNDTDKCAKILGDYHKLNHKIVKADAILCLGNKEYERCLERTLQLYNSNFSKLIIFSGGVEVKDGITEANMLKQRAIKQGISENMIIVENKSTNTGENIVFTQQLLKSLNIKISKFIIVTKGTMERRVYATFKKQWTDNNVMVMVTSPSISFENYPNYVVSYKDLINELVGYTDRVIEYGKLGYQIPQDVPEKVLNALAWLKANGFAGN